MSSFITIMVLVCQVGGANKALLCYEKGSGNIRAEEVKTSSLVYFYKCSNRNLVHCDMDYKLEGCKFIMKDNTISYSSYTCS